MARLLEREVELQRLTATLDAARQGRGALAVVEGAAGTGKSALLGEVAVLAAERGLRTLVARGGELERELPYGAVRQLFERLVASAAADAREVWLAGAAAPAARLLTPDAAPAAPPAADPELGPRHAVYWLASNLAHEQPLLVAVDDLHWVDVSSLRALGYLAHRIADLPLALVLALRPDEPGAPLETIHALCDQPEARRMALAALPRAAVATIVRESVPGADDADCAACFAASAGNPLFLRELLRTIAVPGRRSSLAEAAREAAVASVGSRVLRRIRELGPSATPLARAMAVLGDGGRLGHAATVAGLDEGEAAAAASRMRRIEILASEDPFAFVHPVVRRSVYDEHTVTERDAAHAAAARLLEAEGAPVEVVAAQLAEVRPSGSDGVVAVLRRAADAALRRDAPEAAVAALRRALEEGAPRPGRVELLHELGRLELVGRDPAAVGHLGEALALARDPRERGRIALVLTEILINVGRWSEGVALISSAAAELGEGDPQLALELETFRAVIRAFDPEGVAGFDRDRDRLEALARADTWAGRALSVLLAAALAARGGPVGEVLRLCEQGLRDGRLLAERGAGGWASAQVLSALVLVEATDRAAEVADRLEAEARTQGSLVGVLGAQGFRGWMLARAGDLGGAEELLRPALEAARANEMMMMVTTGLWMLRDPLLELPSLDDVAALVETFPLDPTFAGTGGGAMHIAVRGELRAARGERPAAVADLRAAGATFAGLGFGPVHAGWRSALALALGPEGRDEARALVGEELALADASGLDRPRGIALRAAGLLAGAEEAIGPLARSVAVLEGSPARLEHARSLVELGAALRRLGRRVDAREPLTAGAELALRCGAHRLLERARDELRAAGARPRRVVRSGVAALTASERRVVRLAAAGRTNAEIAQELFVSLKTVETHLMHAYAKLGLAGRGARRRLGELLEGAREEARDGGGAPVRAEPARRPKIRVGP